ncbi:hypothetical protein FSP39_018638 [Pinctada imbricata]|uniref:Uncharacterized protein n=1 Tax=Pinctada imbricata TaxID=66713 RepID=A0AA88Y719_PINIB|nr:hypothetical protein FSP39_018638 [Pinctada imbricata]
MPAKRGLLYRCLPCGYSGERARTLRHYVSEHVMVDCVPFTCSLCNCKAYDEAGIANHLGWYPKHLRIARKTNADSPLTVAREIVKSGTPYVFNFMTDVVACTQVESSLAWAIRKRVTIPDEVINAVVDQREVVLFNSSSNLVQLTPIEVSTMSIVSESVSDPVQSSSCIVSSTVSSCDVSTPAECTVTSVLPTVVSSIISPVPSTIVSSSVPVSSAVSSPVPSCVPSAETIVEDINEQLLPSGEENEMEEEEEEIIKPKRKRRRRESTSSSSSSSSSSSTEPELLQQFKEMSGRIRSAGLDMAYEMRRIDQKITESNLLLKEQNSLLKELVNLLKRQQGPPRSVTPAPMRPRSVLGGIYRWNQGRNNNYTRRSNNNNKRKGRRD